MTHNERPLQSIVWPTAPVRPTPCRIVLVTRDLLLTHRTLCELDRTAPDPLPDDQRHPFDRTIDDRQFFF